MNTRAWFVAGLLGVLMAVVAGCSSPGSVRGGDAKPEAAAPTVRVLSYNIHHGEGVDGVLDLVRIAELIKASNADLVALQELDERTTRTGGVDQLNELARLTGMHAAFAPFMDFQGGRYGLGVLSKYPIADATPIALPEGRREPRSAMAVTVLVPGLGELVFVSVHLDWLDDDAERFEQAKVLIATLARRPRVIVAGDCNDVPGSRTIALFEKSYFSVPKKVGGSATFPSDAPVREIDFVWVRPTDRLITAGGVLNEQLASDHRPVFANITWVP
jgi:endonuclease/exonuclease/phosphatase family metal-dependent hydrolase